MGISGTAQQARQVLGFLPSLWRWLFQSWGGGVTSPPYIWMMCAFRPTQFQNASAISKRSLSGSCPSSLLFTQISQSVLCSTPPHPYLVLSWSWLHEDHLTSWQGPASPDSLCHPCQQAPATHLPCGLSNQSPCLLFSCGASRQVTLSSAGSWQDTGALFQPGQLWRPYGPFAFGTSGIRLVAGQHWPSVMALSFTTNH